MLKRLLLSLAALVTTLSLFPAFAQDVPQPIFAALNDLSGRVGRNVGLLDIEKWSYVQSNYPSPALGCPQSGVAYADVITGGFQFIITYADNDYDYRVANDQSIVILCGTSGAPPATPVCPPADDPGFLPARLSISVQGRVGAGGIPNLVRDQPGSSGNVLSQIPPGDVFTVLDGPRCSLLDKIVWWQVNYNGLVGWTAEGKDGDYWLEPLDLAVTPQPILAGITTANASSLTPVHTSTNPVFAIAPITTSVATGDATGSITVVNFLTQAQQSVTPAHTGAVTSLAFAYDARTLQILLASGGADGLVKIWEVTSQGTLNPLRQINAHVGSVTALALDYRSSLLVTGGDDRSIRVWDVASGTMLKQLDIHTGAIERVDFSISGSSIISRDASGAIIISAVASSTESAG